MPRIRCNVGAGPVGQADCHQYLLGSPEIQLQISGYPSALVKKLRIDAPATAFLRMSEDSKALNCDVALPSKA